MTRKTITPAAIAAFARGDLENFKAASTPGGIEDQERVGQIGLVASSKMPKKMYPSKESFEKLGFVFGKEVDDLFLEAVLPQGWKREATSHSMWSNILDDKNRNRVNVFYKAAFYDRRADANLVCRYIAQFVFPGDERVNLARDEMLVVVLDAGTIIHNSGAFKATDFGKKNQHLKDAISWLEKLHPNHADPTAGW